MVEVRAQRLLAEALARMGWSELALLGIAYEHDMPLAWVAERLKMGSRSAGAGVDVT